jgi:hypothetical protein
MNNTKASIILVGIEVQLQEAIMKLDGFPTANKIKI